MPPAQWSTTRAIWSTATSRCRTCRTSPRRRPTAAGTRTFTVDAVRGDDQWRVLAIAHHAGGRDDRHAADRAEPGRGREHGRPADPAVLVIGAVAVVVLAGVGYVVVRASLRPLREVETHRGRIAAGDLSHRVPDADPRTEVGRLSRRTEHHARRDRTGVRRSERRRRRADQRMRRFVADASHELRTPLTSIRGLRRAVPAGRGAEPRRSGRAMTRIEDEAKRMGLLVEDLLLLARLDQERPLARAPVDLLALASDAVHDAQAIDPDRAIRLDLGATDPPPVVIGDEARLRQVLANLVTNALQAHACRHAGHGPRRQPWRRSVRTRRSPTTVPGMTAEQARRVFERFYRADPARTQRRQAPGWVWPSLPRWSPGTAEPSTSAPRPARGRGSASTCHWPAGPPGRD